MKKRIILISVLFLAAASLMANGGSDAAETDKVSIELQTWVTPNLTVEYWEGLVAEFNKMYPDVEVVMNQATTGDSNASGYLRTRLAAGDMPDVMTNFTREPFIEAEALMALPIDEEVKRLKSLNGMLVDGKLYNYDAIGNVHGLIYFNKTMFAEAGIDSLPKTYADMDEACAKLAAAGFVPFMMAGADWAAGFNLSIWSAPEVFYENQVWYKDRNEGKVSFAEDFLNPLTRFKEYVDKGYIFKGALGTDYTTGQQLFLDGEAAMYPMGAWFSGAPEAMTAGFEVGVFAPVTEDGGAYLAAPANRSGFAVSATTEFPNESIALAKFLGLSPYAVTLRMKTDGGFPDMENSEDYQYEMNPIQKEIAILYDAAEVITNNLNHPVGAAPPAGIGGAFTSAAQTILTGGSVEEALEELDSFWDDGISQ